VAHLKKTPLTLDVLDLVHRPGEYRDKDIDVTAPEGWGNAVIGVREGEPMHLSVRLESLADGILVTADVETIARGECVRCLIDIEQTVQVEIQELFAYSLDEAVEYEVHENHVDLEPVLRDTVVLSLPFQPVCQEDCTGLCPQCGVRLLDNPGHEHEAPVDPRWAALGGLAGLASEELAGDDVIGAGNDVEEEER
jgi:Predicted metal-binding, possibly nucleic acid-binding protein